jgi:hypothetical protein
MEAVIMEDNIIRVSFKNDSNEQQLKDDILSECKIIGKSAWMKLAAKEKLQRDKSQVNNVPSQSISTVTAMPKQIVNNKLPIINELSELFKG